MQLNFTNTFSIESGICTLEFFPINHDFLEDCNMHIR